MRIKKFIKVLNDFKGWPKEDFEVKGISCNSKQIRDDFIFVAIKGNCENGNKYINEAISRGAKVVILESKAKCNSNKTVPFIQVKDSRLALAKLAGHFFGSPSLKIKVIGITGTNGKTTTSYLIEAILKRANLKTAVIGTINYRYHNREIAAKNTTPGPVELGSLFSDMLKEGINYCVMEVSSHALDQNRTDGINFHSAIFTNLTEDHLDYHRTRQNYFKAKLKLFKSLKDNSYAVINNDDKFSEKIKNLTKARVVTYAVKNEADIIAKNIKFDISHTELKLKVLNKEIKFNSHLIGMHNVYNILAGIAWAYKEGIDLSLIKSAIEDLTCVPGRLERIDSHLGFFIFVDYAHTPDALFCAISTLRQLSRGKIIVVFGCGGDREKQKRPKMGRLASELSDSVIITNDNPRSEDPGDIFNDIKKGVRKKNYCIIPNRLKAIKKSLCLAGKGDIVLVAGKGHENYQILKDRRIHFDDREAIRQCLGSMI